MKIRMRETEKNIEVMFRLAVKEMGGQSYKWTSPNNRGVPDRICFLPGGLVIAVELKAPGKVPTKLQMKVIQRLQGLGTEVIVIDSFEGIKIFKEVVMEVLNDGK